MKKKVIILTMLTAALILGFGFSAMADEPIKIKFAHLAPPNTFDSPIHACAMAFKHVVEERTGGRFQVDIYPSGTLGKEVDMMEAVKSGVIQMHMASMGGLGRLFTPVYLFMAPYMFKNDVIGQAVVDGPYTQKMLDAMTEKTGVKGLRWVFLGGYGVFTNNVRQIYKAEDCKGIKFRGMDQLQVAMFQALGASGIPIAWSEVYTALETGVVHGQFNPIYIVEWAKLYEVQKYITQAYASLAGQMLVCNKDWFDKLSPADQKIVNEACVTASLTAKGLGILKDQDSLDALIKKGMDYNVLPPDQVEAFQKLVRPSVTEWLRTKMDPEWVDGFITEIERVEKELGY